MARGNQQPRVALQHDAAATHSAFSSCQPRHTAPSGASRHRLAPGTAAGGCTARAECSPAPTHLWLMGTGRDGGMLIAWGHVALVQNASAPSRTSAAAPTCRVRVGLAPPHLWGHVVRRADLQRRRAGIAQLGKVRWPQSTQVASESIAVNASLWRDQCTKRRGAVAITAVTDHQHASP